MKQYRDCIFMGVLMCSIFLACGTYTVSLPTPEQLAASGDIPKGLDTDALKRGRALAMTECVGCHRLFYPGEYSPEEWKRIIQKKVKRLPFGKEQIEDISFYYTTASTATSVFFERFPPSEME